MTFSIAARCRRTGMVGVAVCTAMPGVGATCTFAAPLTGAVATQARTNPYLGIDGLGRLRQGLPPSEVVRELLSQDPERQERQLGVVDAHGESAAFTGADCVPWCGHLTGPGYSIQGNMLVGGDTLSAMRTSFLDHGHDDLAGRLLAALEAGRAAGGDKRGHRSAAVKVYAAEEYPYLDVRVDDHAEPVVELRRVLEVVQRDLLPFVRSMPRRAGGERDRGGGGATMTPAGNGPSVTRR